MTVRQFRKKPVVIDAIQHTDANGPEVCKFIGGPPYWAERSNSGIPIMTLEGIMWAKPGDWVIKGIQGEFYPCKDDIFRATYEPVEDAS